MSCNCGGSISWGDKEKEYGLCLSHEIRESARKPIPIREVRENPHQEVKFVVCEAHIAKENFELRFVS